MNAFAHDFARFRADSDPAGWALEVLRGEAEALAALAANPPRLLDEAIGHLARSASPVVCCGAGKSGLVAAKVAATMASLGTPAFPLSAADAAHGDLGAVMPGSVVILFSNSGTTAEIVRILPSLRALGCHLIGLVGHAASPLGRAVDTLIELPVAGEVDHLGLAPTASTIVQMAAGDAIAVAASRLRGFSRADFLRAHPAGQLGQRALPVAAMMRRAGAVPVVLPEMPLAEAVGVMSSGMIGAACVVDHEGHLQGLIVDGDIRRAIQARLDLYAITAGETMRRNPVVLTDEASVGDAIDVMHGHKAGLLVLPVVDGAGRLQGILHSMDLVPNA